MNEQQQQKSPAFTLGVVGLIAWLLPIAGFPINIIAIVKGSKGAEGSRDRTGMVMGIIGLSLSTINALIGMMLMA